MLTSLQLLHNEQEYEQGPLVPTRVPVKVNEQIEWLLSKQIETAVVRRLQPCAGRAIWWETTQQVSQQVMGPVRHTTIMRLRKQEGKDAYSLTTIS